jgi:hypothetical protein
VPERFVYHGNATILTGHVHRPSDVWLDVGGVSSLPVNGGASSATLARQDFGGVVAFEAATTHAQGVPHEAKSRRRGAYDEPVSQAHTGAEVRGLQIGTGRLRMTATRLRAELTALCPCHETQPSIGAMDGASIEGVAFGGHRLTVAIDRRFFKDHDTHDKLCEACLRQGRKTRRAVGFTPIAEGETNPAALHTTIVKNLRWNGRPFPKATIDGHVVTIPKFGRVFFGELTVTGPTRRLTMVRFALDGDVVVEGACCEVEAGGTWCR